jgi:hypothetical protein
MKPINFTDVPLAQRPTSKAWQIIAEQCSQGQATIFQDGNVYAVKFTDEPDSIPFEHLDYNAEIGLYDKRQFPSF